MTNFEKIKNMNIDELAAWLNKFIVCDDTPWISWFDNTYCKNCEPEMAQIVGEDRWIHCGWCELNGKCKFFQELDDIPGGEDIVKMWLDKEVV